MIRLKVKLQLQPVVDVLKRKRNGMLRKFGAITRVTAQRSMRTRKGPSPPGKPPHAHGNKLLRKSILFAVDGATVVVGPTLKPSTAKLGIPGAHEHGGLIRSKQNYPSRPYMQPAGNMWLGKLGVWYKES